MHRNVVTVTGTDDAGQAVSFTASEQVFIDNVPTSIEVNFSAFPENIPEPGKNVDFSIVIDNKSTADNVTIYKIADNYFGDLMEECLSGILLVIAPGESHICEFTRYIKGEADDEIAVQVSISGTDDDGTEVGDSANLKLLFLDMPSSLQVTKTADPDRVVAPGGDVTFTALILNDSVADNVLVEHFVDTVYPEIADNCVPELPALLAPGEFITCHLTTYISGEVGDIYTSRVAVSGTDDDGYPVGDTSDSGVLIVHTASGTFVFIPSVWSLFPNYLPPMP